MSVGNLTPLQRLEESGMNYAKWPKFIQMRYALGQCSLSQTSVECTYQPDAQHNVPANAKEVVDWIYAVLTTLDSKASALMRLNGVLIAAAAFLLGLFGRQGATILSTTHVDAVLIVGCALMSALSISFCLLVVNVSWDFLGKVQSTAGEGFNFTEEILGLEKARKFRQTMYRSAWAISLLASIVFLFEFAFQTYHVIRFGLAT